MISSLNDKTRLLCLLLIIGIIILQAAYSLFLAAGKPLWFDEIITLVLGRLRSWSPIWEAAMNRVDGMPPLYHYLEGISLRLPIPVEISLRLPSTIGFSLLLLSLSRFVTRRAGMLSGVLAACVPLVTSAYSYSYEARNYALTLGLTGLALVVWQRIQDRKRLLTDGIILAGLLTACSAINYNAIYGLAPFIVAEAVSALRNHRINWHVVAALLFAFIPYFFYWPIMHRYQQRFGPGFWAKPSLGMIALTVSSLGDVSTAIFIFLAVTIGIFVVVWPGKPHFQNKPPSTVVPAEEWVLGAAFFAIPGVVFVVASVMKAGMAPRYSISMVIGLSVLIAYATRFLKPIALIAIVSCAVTAFMISETRQLKTSKDSIDALWKQYPIISSYLDGKTPIVISDGVAYPQLAYYLSREDNHQLYYINDPAQALHYLGTDTVDLTLPLLTQYAPLQIVDYRQFVADHREFLLYSDSKWDWLEPYMIANHGSLDLLQDEHGFQLYLAKDQSVPPNPH